LQNKDLIQTNESDQIAYIDPIEIEYDFSSGIKNLEIIIDMNENRIKPINTNKENSIKSYLATSFNKRILNKENKSKVELFDIAQAGLEKLNKLTGSKMSLERVYDENGYKDRTEFNSRLLAFSTPIKKD
jgi:hypothetical protein